AERPFARDRCSLGTRDAGDERVGAGIERRDLEGERRAVPDRRILLKNSLETIGTAQRENGEVISLGKLPGDEREPRGSRPLDARLLASGGREREPRRAAEKDAVEGA